MQNEDSKANLLTIGEASEYLGISIDTLRRWEKRGRIEPLRSPGGHRYFNKTDLDNLFGKKYARDEETHRESGPYNNESITLEPQVVNQQSIATRQVIGIPSWRAIDIDENIEKPYLQKPDNESSEILDRPIREVKIPENSRIRVVRTESIINSQQAYFGQQSVSVLTPAPFQASENSINNIYKPANPENIAENRQVASQINPLFPPEQLKPLQNQETITSKPATITNKKTLIYIGITVGVVFLLITWYLLWQSSQKILSQLP